MAEKNIITTTLQSEIIDKLTPIILEFYSSPLTDQSSENGEDQNTQPTTILSSVPRIQEIRKQENPTRAIESFPPKKPKAPKTSANVLTLPSITAVKSFARKEKKDTLIGDSPAVVALATKPFIDDENLPVSYNCSKLILKSRDPYWLFATWEIAANDLQSLKDKIKEQRDQAKVVLRMYDVTFVDFNGTNANCYFDIEVEPANNWYINLWSDHVSYCAELGLKIPNGTFFPLVRSNFVHTPRAGSSSRSEQIWMEVSHRDNQFDGKAFAYVEGSPIDQIHQNIGWENFMVLSYTLKSKGRKFYLTPDDIRRYYERLMPKLREVVARRLTARFGRKFSLQGENPAYRKWLYDLFARWGYLRKRLLGASELTSELEDLNLLGASENQIGASASLMPKGKKRDFFFEIWADLLVYGRTEPDAQVWLKDQLIQLRPDGTFTLRHTLPDGEILFDFTAISSDKIEERKISTQVNRQTKILAPYILQGKI